MTSTALTPSIPTASLTRRVQGGLLDPQELWRSTPDAFRKLNPATLYKNPVMFIVEIGSVFTTWLAIRDHTAFAIITTVWLWLTVLFANLAEAVAEGRGKAQAETLRRAKTDDDGPPRQRLEAGHDGRRAQHPGGRRERSSCRATSSSSRPARRSPATATSSTASPASTSRPSPASRHR